jgi:hypothetical protein
MWSSLLETDFDPAMPHSVAHTAVPFPRRALRSRPHDRITAAGAIGSAGDREGAGIAAWSMRLPLPSRQGVGQGLPVCHCVDMAGTVLTVRGLYKVPA